MLCGQRKEGIAKLEAALAIWDRLHAQLPPMVSSRYRAGCLAYLGRREDALREEQSWELSGIDPWDRIGYKEDLAEIYAVSGDAAEAINTLEQLSHMSWYVSAEELRRHPKWAPLRADPRFPKLLAAWKPL